MSEITEYLRYKRQSRWIYIGAAIVIIVLAFALFKGCQKSSLSLSEAEKSKAIADSLAAKMEADSIAIEKERHQYYTDILEASNESIATEKKADSLQKQLGSSQTEISRLVKQVRFYKEGLPDDDLVLVHPRYIESCDSLADKAEEQNVQIDGLKFESNALKMSLQKEIGIRDEQIEKEKQFNKWLSIDANTYKRLYYNASKAAKPRNKVYLTVSGELLPYPDVMFVVGGGFTVIEKHGNLFGLQTKHYKGWGFEASYGRLLSFRKK